MSRLPRPRREAGHQARRHRRPSTAVRATVAALALVLGLVPTTVGHAADQPGPGSSPTGSSLQDGGGPSQAEIDRVMDQVRDELAESSEAMVRAAADLRLAESALPGAEATADHARALLAQARRRAAAAAKARGAAQVRLMLSSQTAEESAARTMASLDSASSSRTWSITRSISACDGPPPSCRLEPAGLLPGPGWSAAWPTVVGTRPSTSASAATVARTAVDGRRCRRAW